LTHKILLADHDIPSFLPTNATRRSLEFRSGQNA